MAEGEQRTRPSVASLLAVLGKRLDGVSEDAQTRLRKALRTEPGLVTESLEESFNIWQLLPDLREKCGLIDATLKNDAGMRRRKLRLKVRQRGERESGRNRKQRDLDVQICKFGLLDRFEPWVAEGRRQRIGRNGLNQRRDRHDRPDAASKLSMLGQCDKHSLVLPELVVREFLARRRQFVCIQQPHANRFTCQHKQLKAFTFIHAHSCPPRNQSPHSRRRLICPLQCRRNSCSRRAGTSSHAGVPWRGSS